MVFKNIIDITELSSRKVIEKLVKKEYLGLARGIIFVCPDRQVTSDELIKAVKHADFTDKFDKSPEVVYVQLPADIDSGVFISLITFVYRKTLDDWSTLADIHSTAIRYWMNDLSIELLNCADDQLRILNSIILYDQYLKLGEVVTSKLSEVVDIVCIHAHLAFLDDAFTKISESTLINLLNMDRLLISEKDVWYAVLRWIKAKLVRDKLEDNLVNRLAIFNPIKNLIRFPTMSYEQFFYSDKECPANSNFFTDDELVEFEKYFDTKDESYLTINYETTPRAQMNYGKMELVPVDEDEEDVAFLHGSAYAFKMSTEVNDSFYYGNQDNGSTFKDCGNSHKGVLNRAHVLVKPKKANKKERKNNLVCTNDTIRVIRIDVTGSPSSWIEGNHLMVTEDDELLFTLYQRYSIDETFGYYSYQPTFEMKKGSLYKFKFVLPGQSIEEVSVKLESLYSKNEDGEEVIDVQMKIIGGLNLEHAHKIIFLYK